MMPPTEGRFVLACAAAGPSGVAFEGDGGPEEEPNHRAGMAAQLEACRAVLTPALGDLRPRLDGLQLTLQCRRERRRRPGVGDAIDHYHGLIVQLVVRGPHSRVPVLWQHIDRGDLETALAAALAGEIRAEVEAAGSKWLLGAPRSCPIILAQWPAALFVHECIGHLSEADNYLAHATAAGFDLGERWCRYPLRVVDDPTLPGLRGGYTHDDEGEPAAPTVLVDGGVWRGLLYDRALAHALGAARSGNGRRVPGAAGALPRMSILRADGGADDLESLVARVGRGILCLGAFGGRSAGMNFVLRPAYGRWIEDGRLTGRILRRFDLVGDKRTAVAAIAGLSKAVEMFDPLFGCDKDEQDALAVSMGAPHILLEEIELRPIERSSH